MVHDEFQAATGRTILVRIDDLTPAEREDIANFFHSVKRLFENDVFAGLYSTIAGIITAVSVLISAICVGATDDMIGRVLLASALMGGVVGMTFWLGLRGLASRHRAEILREINAIFGRSERCRIAAEQLRRTDASHAQLLPVPASAPSAG